MIEQISFIEKRVKETEAEISSIMGKLGSPITTITGIGSVTGAAILSEIGDISKLTAPEDRWLLQSLMPPSYDPVDLEQPTM